MTTPIKQTHLFSVALETVHEKSLIKGKGEGEVAVFSAKHWDPRDS